MVWAKLSDTSYGEDIMVEPFIEDDIDLDEDLYVVSILARPGNSGECAITLHIHKLTLKPSYLLGTAHPATTQSLIMPNVAWNRTAPPDTQNAR